MFKDLSRRRFLAGSTAAAGALSLTGSLAGTERSKSLRRDRPTCSGRIGSTKA